jgi:hypothetical protein
MKIEDTTIFGYNCLKFKMKKICGWILILLICCSCAWATNTNDFGQTISLMQKALFEKNTDFLLEHIDLNGIVKAKIKKLSSQASKQKSKTSKMTGKAIGFTEPILTKLATHFITKEFSKSTLSLRQKYLDALIISKTGGNDQVGFAYGTFAGKPATIVAIKEQGKWIIIGVESPIIDQELNILLNYLKR